MTRKIVITGMGAVTPLSVGVEESWKRLCAGESGIKNVTQFDASSLKCQVAGFDDISKENFLWRADFQVRITNLQWSLTSLIGGHE